MVQELSSYDLQEELSHPLSSAAKVPWYDYHLFELDINGYVLPVTVKQ